MRDDARRFAFTGAKVVLRLAREHARVRLNNPLRVLGQPRVVYRHMVRDEIEDESQARLSHARAKVRKPFVAA